MNTAIENWLITNPSYTEADRKLFTKIIEEYKTTHEIENKSIRIPVTDNDIEELRDGGSFNWTFPVEDSIEGEWIDVELVNDNEEQE
jgi:hypothetical protein